MTGAQAQAAAARRRESSAAYRISHPEIVCVCTVPVPRWNRSCPACRVCQACRYPMRATAPVARQAVKTCCTCDRPDPEPNGELDPVYVCHACGYVVAPPPERV